MKPKKWRPLRSRSLFGAGSKESDSGIPPSMKPAVSVFQDGYGIEAMGWWRSGLKGRQKNRLLFFNGFTGDLQAPG